MKGTIQLPTATAVHATQRQYIVADEPTLMKLVTAGQAGKTRHSPPARQQNVHSALLQRTGRKGLFQYRTADIAHRSKADGDAPSRSS